MNVSSLKVQIKLLEDAGLLEISRTIRDGVNLPNQYVLQINKVGGANSDGMGQNLATNQ